MGAIAEAVGGMGCDRHTPPTRSGSSAGRGLPSTIVRLIHGPRLAGAGDVLSAWREAIRTARDPPGGQLQRRFGQCPSRGRSRASSLLGSTSGRRRPAAARLRRR